MRQRNSEPGREPASRSGSGKLTKNTAQPRKDFWDTIAEDVANGYRKGSRGRGIYNTDQQRDDNRRGDEVA
ncbi:MAG: hypothetical protein JWP69_1180 [Flaviaesturariibacter sp.]|nr:hypothetical protein [Flaviaesturariibacter sp.]